MPDDLSCLDAEMERRVALLNRRELGLRKIQEEMDRLTARLESEDFSDIRRASITAARDAYAMALTWMESGRAPRLRDIDSGRV